MRILWCNRASLDKGRFQTATGEGNGEKKSRRWVFTNEGACGTAKKQGVGN